MNTLFISDISRDSQVVSFDSKLCIDGDPVSVQLVTLPTIAAPGRIIVTIFRFPSCFVYIPIIKERRIWFSN